jgi:hypothetical protein
MAYYGVGGGWCFSSGAFVGHVKLMFMRGRELEPEPPVTRVELGKSTRGVELAFVDDLDERPVASWMEQAAIMPFLGEWLWSQTSPVAGTDELDEVGDDARTQE